MKILKVAIEASFKPSLTFYDKQGEIGNRIWEKNYPDWETTGRNIIFRNIDKKEVCLVEYRRVVAIKERVGEIDPKEFPIENFLAALNSFTTSLTDSQILRIGIRVIGFHDCKMQFKEISEIMRPKIYPESQSKLYSVLSDKLEDVSFATVYEKEGKKIRFQCGPVTKAELLLRSELGFPPDKDSPLPENSIYLDIDAFLNNPAKGTIPKFLKESVEIITSDSVEFIKYIFEK